MKKLTWVFSVALAFCLASLAAGAAELNWKTDLTKAIAQAKKENKLVFINFTGSDWCGWCIKMDRETFSKDQFSDYAKANLIPVVLDFPHNIDQPTQLKATNEALQEKFKVEGFPTMIALDGSGKEVWRHEGYLEGGPQALIDELKPLKKK